MKPMTVRMGSGGKITIPKKIIVALRLKAGMLFRVGISKEMQIVLTPLRGKKNR